MTRTSRLVSIAASLALAATSFAIAPLAVASPGAQVSDGGSPAARAPKVLSRSAELYVISDSGWSLPSEQDLSNGLLSVAQNLATGTVTATGAYLATPTAELNSELVLLLGAYDSAGDCRTVVTLRGRAVAASATDASATYADGSSAGTARRSLAGDRITLTLTGGGATDPGLDCVRAEVLSTNGELLGATFTDDFEAVLEKVPTLGVTTGAVHVAYAGRWNKVAFTVRNTGTATAKNVKLALSGSKLTFRSKTLSIGTLAPGASKKVTARVKLKGTKTRTLTARVTASGGWTARTTAKVGHRAKPTKVKSLVGKSYWASFSGTGSQRLWQVRGLTFVDKRWVYVGVPKAGTPKCSSKVKGCEKYSYSAKKGTLKIGKLRAKVDSEGITVTKVAKKGDRKLTYEVLGTVKKGARLNVRLEHTDAKGQCGISATCTTWTQGLTLKKNGKFTWSWERVTLVGFPPDQHATFDSRPTKSGTYQVLSKNRIRFTYRDDAGKKKRETYTLAVLADRFGKHAPMHGLLIGTMPHLPTVS